MRKAFITQFIAKMDDRNILTNEQWSHLQKLFDDPPQHAKIFFGEMTLFDTISEARKKSDNNAESKDDGSWQPGDAIPEQYRQERNDRSRFPRGAE